MGIVDSWNAPIALHNLADLLTFVSFKWGEILANVMVSLSEGLPVHVPNQISNSFRQERHDVEPHSSFFVGNTTLQFGAKTS